VTGGAVGRRRWWLSIAAVAVLMLASAAATTRATTQAVALGGGETLVSQANPDGTTSYDFYDAPSGPAGARQLAGAKPIQPNKVEDPGGGGGGGSCYHGTAHAEPASACPPWTWTYQGHVRPIVYFHDASGSSWPVSTAVSVWNQSLGIDSYWQPSTTPCPDNVHCAFVYEINDSTKHVCGQTHLVIDGNHHFVEDADYILLNDYYFAHTDSDGSRCTGTKRSTACHEIGHMLGLDHNDSKSSCIYYQSVSDRSQVPNSDDFYVLQYISY